MRPNASTRGNIQMTVSGAVANTNPIAQVREIASVVRERHARVAVLLDIPVPIRYVTSERINWSTMASRMPGKRRATYLQSIRYFSIHDFGMAAGLGARDLLQASASQAHEATYILNHFSRASTTPFRKKRSDTKATGQRTDGGPLWWWWSSSSLNVDQICRQSSPT